MKKITFLFVLISYSFFSQESKTNQLYFIGEKIMQQSLPLFKVQFPPERQDCKEDDEDIKCRPFIIKSECFEYCSEYKIVKILKGNYDKQTIHFASAYCSDLGYRHPLDKKYLIIGVINDDKGNYYQNYMEKVYRKKDKWVVPYTTQYPFIDYLTTHPQRLKKGQRIKIDTDKQFYETYYLQKYELPFYEKKGRHAISVQGFLL